MLSQQQRMYACMSQLICLLVVGLQISVANAEWFSRSEAIMGTKVHVQLWHDNELYAKQAIDLVLIEMHRIDALMSTYKADSELSEVNQHAANRAVLVSDELFELIRSSLEFGRVTEGAFDITYASVGQFYDFRASVSPTDRQKHNALTAVGWSHVVLDDVARSVRYSMPGVRVDLGGIAKGHAVESAVALLKEQGIAHAIVTAGGDSRVLGDHRGRPWAVGIRDPRKKDGLIARLPVQEEAISTSGDYERYFEMDGKRYHHIIEPGTGESARTLQSVTVIGPNAMMTDALSTGVFVLGMERGLKLIDTMDEFEAVIIDAQGTMHFSRGLEPGA